MDREISFSYISRNATAFLVLCAAKRHSTTSFCHHYEKRWLKLGGWFISYKSCCLFGFQANRFPILKRKMAEKSTQEKVILITYIIIIIMSRRQRGYPWPSLAISPYHSSPPAGLQGYILCPHIVAVCMLVLVVPLLHIHMWGSTGVHRLWARPCFSSSDLRVWFVELV